ncbi:tape measure protein [Gilvimarinus sp. 1_MG-2023]|uniref:tape measure protein n=1 Tax=Gilvimarinus sp. 1_MG-2023 TaxID=3062638 RepID=UPI0026E41439|nr:tape measure protein [Gilvimarinus sp. 1_MG-2023]MDO6747213.1 tape measure protein [Gilvimarinus sp. 1_MG-2023]
MALKDSVLNIVIKAKNLAGDTLRKFRSDLEGVDETSVDASKSVEDLGKSADKAGKKVGDAGKGVDDLKQSLDKTDQSATDTASALGKSEKALDEIAKSGSESAKATDKAGKSAQKLGQRYDAAGKPIDSARSAINKNNKELRDVEGNSQKAGTSIGSLTKRLLGLAAAAVGIGTITGKLREMLATGDRFEKLEKQMTATMGSLQEGQKATEWIKDFTSDTPLQLEQVTETFTTLKNFGLDPLNGSMQSIVDQAAKLGKGYEGVRGISLALGQAWAKQKLQGEEILQLIERGVPVWELLEEVTGKNTAELQELSSAGALGRDTIKALIDEMGRQSTGAAAANMSLLSGYISNLKDEWALFLNEIAQAGALDYAKDQLSSLLDTVKAMREDGRLGELAKSISDGFVTIAEATKSVVLAIKDNIGAIGTLGKAYLALKIADTVTGFKSLAFTIGTSLVSGTKAATVQTRLLANALRAVPYVLLVGAVQKVISAYGQMRSAQNELAKSQRANADTQAKAAAAIKKFNDETGRSVTSLDEIIQAQKDGSAKIDEYTGKWRLATDALTDAEKAQRAQAEAAKEARAEQEALNQIHRQLLESFRDTRNEGKSLAEAIEAMGEKARQSGDQGITALSIAIENLALEGEATRSQLSAGLGEYLASLSDEQYTAFGEAIAAEFKRVQEGSDKTANRLKFLQTLLEGQLVAAAKKAGVDIGEVLQGVDEESQKAISSFSDLASALQHSGKSSEEVNKILRAGLLQTLESLDSSEEVEATISAIEKLGEAGVISSGQVGALVDQIRQKSQQLREEASQSATSQIQGNAAVESSVDGVTESLKRQEQQAEATGGGAAAVNKIYQAIRSTVSSLGPAAEAAFDKLRGIDTGAQKMTGEFAELEQEINDANKAIEKLRTLSAGDFTGVSNFMREVARDAAYVRKEYAEQKIALEQLKNQFEDNSISAAEFAQQARGALNSTSLLGEQDLAYLRQAIRDAEQQMESFRDSTEDTLNSLQAELAQLQGQQAEVERLNYESRVRQLEEQLEQARQSGDQEAIANAQAALKIAQEIYQVKLDQISAEQTAAEQSKADAAADLAASQQRAEEQAKADKSESSSPTTKLESITRVILEDQATGQEVTVDTDNPDALLDTLSRFGRRVT